PDPGPRPRPASSSRSLPDRPVLPGSRPGAVADAGSHRIPISTVGAALRGVASPRMLLAIDVGNSNTSIGVFEGAELRCELRLATRRDWTRDEFAIKLERALALQGFEFKGIHSSVLACVVPPVVGPISSALQRYIGVEVLVVGPGVETGMPVLYEPPKDVGADRIVAAIAAHQRYAKSPEAGDSDPRAGI